MSAVPIYQIPVQYRNPNTKIISISSKMPIIVFSPPFAFHHPSRFNLPSKALSPHQLSCRFRSCDFTYIALGLHSLTLGFNGCSAPSAQPTGHESLLIDSYKTLIIYLSRLMFKSNLRLSQGPVIFGRNRLKRRMNRSPNDRRLQKIGYPLSGLLI